MKSSLASIGRLVGAAQSTSRVTGLEVAAVIGLLMSVQVLAFRGYYLGVAAPSGDFLGPYSNESYAWWHSGGLLNPPEWMPYLWGGYPAMASIQNSAWYLPTGLASLFGLSIQTSAIVQALHVGLGGLGVYVLGRRAGFGRIASSFGLVAYSFTTGFFSNAPYTDIVRGHALAPWILLCLSPLWPWRRRWAVPAAALLLWQTAMGVYPGMIVAFAYGGAVWFIVWQILARPKVRNFAGPLAAAALVALLLSMPKYLPLLVLQTVQPGPVEDLSGLARSTLGTFLLPGFYGLPGIASMNTYFVPATVLLLCAFARWKDRVVRAGIAAAAFAVVATLPFSAGLVNSLPGFSASRFRENDMRPLIILPLVFLAMSGTARLLAAARSSDQSFHVGRRVALLASVPTAAAAFLVLGKFRDGDWIPTTVALGICTVVVVAVSTWLTSPTQTQTQAQTRTRRGTSVVVGVLLLSVTAGSGLASAAATKSFWAADSVAMQQNLWGVTSSELITHAVDLTGATQRPGRSTVHLNDPTRSVIDTSYNSAYYTGLPSVGGYLNVHNSASFVEASRSLANPTTAESALSLLSAPGIVIGWPEADLPKREAVLACVETGSCVGIFTRPLTYSSGRLVYSIKADVPMRVIVNEAYYVGWQAVLIDPMGRSQKLSVGFGPSGLIQLTLPEGSWQLSLVYVTPHESLARVLALIGLLALLVWSVANPPGLHPRRLAAIVSAVRHSRQ